MIAKMNRVCRGGRAATKKIAEILEILNDGQWHMLHDVQQKAQLNENLTRQVIAFLKEYELVSTDKTDNRVKLRKVARRFLARNTSS
jgi:DNA-binding IclR family transcriptional regulator